jgi:DNA invertase Pin-like site-specific DNA recombinase
MKSVVAYCRVSTDQQADSGLSIEAQREQLVSFTIASGLELAKTPSRHRHFRFST